MPTARRSKPRKGRKRFVTPLTILTVLGVVAAASFLSPWPSALFIRAVFDVLGISTTAQMEEYAPPAGSVDETLDVQYAQGGGDTQLDVFSPSESDGPLPTVVWIHGGAWIQGDKSSRDPYARLLAVEGYTVVTVNYALAPEKTYPTAITQLNTALGFLVDRADDYRIDPDQIVIAGDSAGSQLAGQLATIITNPAYAVEVDIPPTLAPEQVAGVLLNCGVYDVSEIPNSTALAGWAFRTSLWAYLGSKDWSNTPGGEEMSIIDDVTAYFPATWISGGNADPLTATQSQPFSARLKELGVDVTELFFSEDTVPALDHEYQFHLDLDSAHLALESTIDWLDRITTHSRSGE